MLLLSLGAAHVDVVFPLCFAGAAGLLSVAHAWQTYPWRRRILAVSAPLLLGVNIALTICFAATYPRQSPQPIIERIFNAPVYLWETLSGDRPPNTLELHIAFSTAPVDTREGLLQVGGDKVDVIFIHYLENERATLGFFHADLGAVESEPFPLGPGVPRVVELKLGSLCPPPGHPVLAGWTPSAIEHAQRRLEARIDGQIALSQDVLFHPRTGAYVVGKANQALNYRPFSGHIVRVTTLPALPPDRSPVNWPARPATFDVFFSNRPIGRSEPLLTSGIRTAGDLLRVTYLDSSHIQLVFEHGMASEVETPPIDLPLENRKHRISIRPQSSAGRTSVLFDEAVVLTLDFLPFPAPFESVYSGILSYPANCEPMFGGRIDAVVPPTP